ncbi:MAG: HEAT repeat domain-containing protein [Candidatus Poribacteria bacterium]|nr:HEAT repeat domain-containing protein [Candidatus Poribacteria bacterium]
MVDKQFLLNDAQMQQFIADGYITVRADYPPAFHAQICQQLDTVFEHEGNIGNNILPRIPQIQRVFDHPALRGALTSLVGEGYIMNPHRHCHLNPPGSNGQHWHKDCYVFDHNIRHPRFHWILALYYPQDTTEDMGPTGILPGAHFYKTISDADPQRTREPALPLCGEAGTVALVHFDAWHRATANQSAKKRYMLKFQFARMREPSAPSWNHRSHVWEAETDGTSMGVWNWLCGNGWCTQDIAASSAALVDALDDASETARLNAAYTLGMIGESVVPTLIDTMRRQTIASIEETTAKPPDNLHGTNPTAGCAAQALSVIGLPAVSALVEILDDKHWWVRAVAADILTKIGPVAKQAVSPLTRLANDEHWWVRRNAIEALGTIGCPSSTTVRLLVERLRDTDYRVRRNAAITLAKFGQLSAPAIPALVDTLEDENRYNRFYAVSALRHIGTPPAEDALLDALFTARWCPITTKESAF